MKISDASDALGKALPAPVRVADVVTAEREDLVGHGAPPSSLPRGEDRKAMVNAGAAVSKTTGNLN